MPGIEPGANVCTDEHPLFRLGCHCPSSTFSCGHNRTGVISGGQPVPVQRSQRDCSVMNCCLLTRNGRESNPKPINDWHLHPLLHTVRDRCFGRSGVSHRYAVAMAGPELTCLVCLLFPLPVKSPEEFRCRRIDQVHRQPDPHLWVIADMSDIPVTGRAQEPADRPAQRHAGPLQRVVVIHRPPLDHADPSLAHRAAAALVARQSLYLRLDPPVEPPDR